MARFASPSLPRGSVAPHWVGKRLTRELVSQTPLSRDEHGAWAVRPAARLDRPVRVRPCTLESAASAGSVGNEPAFLERGRRLRRIGSRISGHRGSSYGARSRRRRVSSQASPRPPATGWSSPRRRRHLATRDLRRDRLREREDGRRRPMPSGAAWRIDKGAARSVSHGYIGRFRASSA
jgi:hypothetical protein